MTLLVLNVVLVLLAATTAILVLTGETRHKDNEGALSGLTPRGRAIFNAPS